MTNEHARPSDDVGGGDERAVTCTELDAVDGAVSCVELPPTDALVLVPIAEYRPGRTVCVVDRLPAPTTVRLLSLPCAEREPVLTRPDEFTGYVVRSTTDGGVEATTFVFLEGRLQRGRRYTFTTDARVFSVALDLLEVTIEVR